MERYRAAIRLAARLLTGLEMERALLDRCAGFSDFDGCSLCWRCSGIGKNSVESSVESDGKYFHYDSTPYRRLLLRLPDKGVEVRTERADQ
jgi:hypothetical protein